MADSRNTQQLKKRIAKIESDINKIVNTTISSTESSSIFWSRLQKDLRGSYNKARVSFRDWSDEEITRVYNKSVATSLKKVNDSKAFTGHIKVKQFKGKDIHKQTINSLIDEANAGYLSGLSGGEKEMLRLMAYQQQINATEIVGDFIIQEKKRLEKKAIEGKYLKLTDKNGKDRFYNLKDYTDMTIRTKLRESSTMGVVNTATGIGADLVQVSSHNTKTEFDAQFEGKIFSLSGKDPDFPAATFLPPFHPNCLHSISIIFKETLERRGIQKYIDFSTGKTGVHPTRKSFIPVDERALVA
jgi:hypothetical protein